MTSMPDESTTRPIDLPSRLTIGEVADWHQSILDTMTVSPALTIDAGSVERIDTAGLQLLAALAVSALTRGGTLHWESVSPEVMSGAERLGLVATLNLPTAEATLENR